MPSFPPLHPAVVHFPIALIVFSVLVEFIAYFRPESNLKALAKWTMVGACIGGVLTVVAGLIDLNRLPGHNSYVHFHMQVGFIMFSLLVGLTVWRWFIDRLARPVSKLYMTGAAMLLVLTLFQGWLGGELVFSHGFAVAPTENRIEPADLAQARLSFLDPLLPNSHGQGAAAHSEGSHGAGSAHSPPEKNMAGPQEESSGTAHAGHANDANNDGIAQSKDSAKPSATTPSVPEHPQKLSSAPQEQGKDAAHAGHAEGANSGGKAQSKDSAKSPASARGYVHSASADERTPVAKQEEDASYEHPKGTLAHEATAEELKRDGISIPTATENTGAGKSVHQH